MAMKMKLDVHCKTIFHINWIRNGLLEMTIFTGMNLTHSLKCHMTMNWNQLTRQATGIN